MDELLRPISEMTSHENLLTITVSKYGLHYAISQSTNGISIPLPQAKSTQLFSRMGNFRRDLPLGHPPTLKLPILAMAQTGNSDAGFQAIRLIM